MTFLEYRDFDDFLAKTGMTIVDAVEYMLDEIERLEG